jgi:hypothetical protein
MAAGDTTPFLRARAASVGFNPISLLGDLVTRSEIGADRLTFEGTELTLAKSPSGTYRLQGAPTAATEREQPLLRVPPDIDVLVDSRVLYLTLRARCLGLPERGRQHASRR